MRSHQATKEVVFYVWIGSFDFFCFNWWTRQCSFSVFVAKTKNSYLKSLIVCLRVEWKAIAWALVFVGSPYSGISDLVVVGILRLRCHSAVIGRRQLIVRESPVKSAARKRSRQCSHSGSCRVLYGPVPFTCQMGIRVVTNPTTFQLKHNETCVNT